MVKLSIKRELEKKDHVRCRARVWPDPNGAEWREGENLAYAEKSCHSQAATRALGCMKGTAATAGLQRDNEDMRL
jgi:hypothetical protein